MVGIAEGYLAESVPGTGVYDQYEATWKIRRLGDAAISAIINLKGTVVYQTEQELPGTELHVLQSSFEGAVLGDYSGPLSSVLTHVRIVNGTPYEGRGFSAISYVSDSSSGAGWTYDRVVSPGVIELKGLSAAPLFGVLSGTLTETTVPRALVLRVDRVDLGLPPAADLNVTAWGLSRVSPGQTVNYVIEYRNDGLKASDEAVIAFSVDPSVEYIGASEGAYYDDFAHAVSWVLSGVEGKSSGYLSIRAYVPWGLQPREKPAVLAVLARAMSLPPPIPTSSMARKVTSHPARS
jgi:hypothetical protein